MDWYVVEYLYPKAFKKFSDVMFPNLGILTTSSLMYYDIKKLYGFFDKQGIYLTIEYYNPNQWYYSISLNNGSVFSNTNNSIIDREISETEGFMECFKMLDNKLRKEEIIQKYE
jgi:hypothetical protein